MVPGKYSSLEKRHFGQCVQNKRLFLCFATAAATAAAAATVSFEAAACLFCYCKTGDHENTEIPIF